MSQFSMSMLTMPVLSKIGSLPKDVRFVMCACTLALAGMIVIGLIIIDARLQAAMSHQHFALEITRGDWFQR